MTTKSETLSDAVSAFAAQWFKYLDRHAPADQLASCLSNDDLVMVFPERTLRSVADFRDWYAKVCDLYTDETHEIEEVTPAATGDRIDVTVVVVWRATQTSDDSRLAMRARQTWRLARTNSEQGLVITEYRVDELAAL
ncbi:nuclear transport factor 2 family protein [Actinoplanes subglobosus]|uniref:Nuclear transport factor 2 family protein n=1 Tax=Actinoplanes subglobosus TaxID=1547892 RepID=A0ABV8IGV7_9ACTN